MEDIETLSKVINTLLSKNFVMYIEDGRVVPFCFKPENIHHILGLQYLDDMLDIKNAKNKASFIKEFLRSARIFERIKRSAYFEKIKDRIEHLSVISDMLISDKCEVVIEFDSALLAFTTIKSKFLLYKTEDYKRYYILGIAKRGECTYYPETYLVENSKYYVSGQTTLSCIIECTEFKRGGKR